jgi:predicted DNA-binding protein
MSDAAFEGKVSGIFKRMEQKLAGRLSVEKTKAENLQSQDSRRTAFILTEAIEAELKPAVKEALSTYEEAISRPMTPNERWEHIVTQQIGKAVEEAIKQALALDDEKHPWKPLLSDEAPKLRGRLVTAADEHFQRLGKMGARRRRTGDEGAEWTMRIVMLAVGILLGYVLARLIHH